MNSSTLHGRRTILMCLSSCLLALPALAQQSVAKRDREVFAPDAHEDAKGGRTLLVDTREVYEKVSGSPDGVGAEITYFMDGRQDTRFVADVLRVPGGKRDASVTLICQAGIRSAQALGVLERNGFSNAHVVINGFQGWTDLDVPRKLGK